MSEVRAKLLDEWALVLGDSHDDLRDELLARWSEPHRHYHDLRHLAETLDALEGLGCDAPAARLAVWFHDAVHCGAPSDEIRSAELATVRLRGLGLPDALVGEVHRLILLTIDHAPDPDDALGGAVCDADLAILAASPSRYAESVADLRLESPLPDDQWCLARRASVQQHLARPRLYASPLAGRRFEAAARANLSAELAGPSEEEPLAPRVGMVTLAPRPVALSRPEENLVNCPKCGKSVPEESSFCFACGTDLRSPDQPRTSFAIKPDESVRSFKLVSTIMPKGAGEHPRTYQIALAVALIASIIAAVLGALPVALLLAAFSIPIVYIVYLYDVNLWEDAPVPVTMLAFVLTFVLGVGFTLLWLMLRGPQFAVSSVDGGFFAPTLSGVLVMALLVPVVGEIIRQVGPLVLASRPQFDDLMDGLTFGIISGVAYSTADTLVKHWDLLTGGFSQPGQDALTWVSLFVLEGFVKPLVIGSATGIAAAEFSGLGRGYDGFTGRYIRAFIEAVAWNIAYFGGTYLLTFVVPAWGGLLASILLGLVLLGALILRIRSILQTGLLEAALEDAARDAGVGETGELTFCPVCEMPKMPAAAFCSNCGTAARSTSERKAQAAAASITQEA